MVIAVQMKSRRMLTFIFVFMILHLVNSDDYGSPPEYSDDPSPHEIPQPRLPLPVEEDCVSSEETHCSPPDGGNSFIANHQDFQDRVIFNTYFKGQAAVDSESQETAANPPTLMIFPFHGRSGGDDYGDVGHVPPSEPDEFELGSPEHFVTKGPEEFEIGEPEHFVTKGEFEVGEPEDFTTSAKKGRKIFKNEKMTTKSPKEFQIRDSKFVTTSTINKKGRKIMRNEKNGEKMPKQTPRHDTEETSINPVKKQIHGRRMQKQKNQIGRNVNSTPANILEKGVNPAPKKTHGRTVQQASNIVDLPNQNSADKERVAQLKKPLHARTTN